MDANCTGTVSGMATVTILPTISATLSGPQNICAGDSALLSLDLNGAGIYVVSIAGAVSPIQFTASGDTTFYVFPVASSTYTIQSVTVMGNTCPANISGSVTVSVSSVSATAQLSDYSGFNVSCPGENDGSITIIPNGGTAPYNINWNTGPSGPVLDNIAAGSYAMTLTDAIGCSFIDSFILTEPAPLSFTFTTKAPDCFDGRNGAITITDAQGGSGPYMVAVNTLPAQVITTIPATITPIDVGTYTLTLQDANGCTQEAPATVPPPPIITLDLGPDQAIHVGDSLELKGLTTNSAPIATITWTPTTYLSSPDSVDSWAKPLQTTRYELLVVDTAGCSAIDDILITVDRSERVYIPNVLLTDASNDNGNFTVYTGNEVINVTYLRIYDRWGELLFENSNFQPGQPALGWDGRAKGKPVNPGVYVYTFELEFYDHSTKEYVGDVTVIR